MLKEIADFLLQKDEPARSCLLALREHILNYDPNITEVFKFNMPFFCYKGESFCYLSVYKKNGLPYAGFTDGKRIDHPNLIMGDRARIKILPLDPAIDLPVGIINSVLEAAIRLCK
ncbi:MAG: hypothetical protein JWP37_3429 [Mucilaginibacter sp.]|nr:hypothetical protein [Mucilaginibacter sp.]